VRAKKPIFVFGLDGATFKIIDSFINKGHLPFIKKLAQQGIKKNLIGSFPPITAPSWSSFITAGNLGKHGVYDFVIKKAPFSDKSGRVASGSCLKDEPFWQQWVKDGKRVALINLPMTWPINKIKNGLTISSVLTPRGRDWYYPKKIGSILEKVGYRIEDFDFLDRIQKEQTSSFEKTRNLKQMAKSKYLLTKELIAKNNWDFFFMLFSETDWSQHLFWRGKQTLELYQTIDSCLEDIYNLLVKKYGARNFFFLLISDHGFHPAPKVMINIFPFLRKNNLLKKSPKAALARILRKISFWEKDKNASRFKNWGENDLIRVSTFGLWLNKKKLGKNYSNFRNQVIDCLKQVKYQNGFKVFKWVKKGEAVFSGKYTKNLWDVVWLTNTYFTIGKCSIERKVFAPHYSPMKAIHNSDRNGIFIAKGIGIKTRLKQEVNKKIYIWDMAAIFDKLLDFKRRTTKSIRPSIKKKKPKKADKIIIDRLKSLGYL